MATEILWLKVGVQITNLNMIQSLPFLLCSVVSNYSCRWLKAASTWSWSVTCSVEVNNTWLYTFTIPRPSWHVLI